MGDILHRKIWRGATSPPPLSPYSYSPGKGRCHVSKLVMVRQGEDEGDDQLVIVDFQ